MKQKDGCHWEISWAWVVYWQTFQEWFVQVMALTLNPVLFLPLSFPPSHERKTCHSAPALQFLVWSPCPCSPTLTLAMLWWEWQTKTCDLPLPLKLRTWPLLIVYQRNFLPSESFLYISEEEGQLNLGKYCLPLKQLVVWVEPKLSPTA